MPRTRRATLTGVVAALTDGTLHLDVGSDRDEARARLAELPGIGPWTVECIAMRALGDPDAFTPTDLGLRRAAAGLGMPATPPP
ncbi:DNA-3-methyladenine glycosylase [Streptomyces noursei]|uniref:DNA-3-methyladenine glycosylase n=1 Tax=Streptomyces noursei TaxID=1971 RepID=A0A401RAA2_STRNR|nr:DNA-3-methyladenine glycosylase [Streptomyces noursei]